MNGHEGGNVKPDLLRRSIDNTWLVLTSVLQCSSQISCVWILMD